LLDAEGAEEGGASAGWTGILTIQDLLDFSSAVAEVHRGHAVSGPRNSGIDFLGEVAESGLHVEAKVVLVRSVDLAIENSQIRPLNDTAEGLNPRVGRSQFRPNTVGNVSNKVSNVADSANNYWNSMVKTNGRSYLWSDAASTKVSADLTTCYRRISTMAQGWAMTGSSLYHNSSLATDILSALDWMYAHRYNETKSKYNNWWDWNRNEYW
jgi:hypothetical protein